MGLTDELTRELASIREQGLERTLRAFEGPQATWARSGSREWINFASNDYLGLANDPRLKEAAIRAIDQYGAGAGASRLICGSLLIHRRLEEELASFEGAQAALAFGSGYMTALGTLPAVAGKGDRVIVDRLVHASIIDAARLSGADLRVYPHNDLGRLEEILKRYDRRAPGGAQTVRRPRTIVATESVFSMDGNTAPLAELVEIKERRGAWLLLDEAHATGLFGPRRSGLAEAQGVASRVDVRMGTLGKALGASGGFICGARPLIDLLVNRARSFIFSTAPPPAAAGAAREGVRLAAGPEGERRCARLWSNLARLRAGLGAEACSGASPIVPVLAKDESLAVLWAERLNALGLLVPAVRYPAVGRGQARLRVTLSSEHREADIDRLADALRALAEVPRAEPPKVH